MDGGRKLHLPFFRYSSQGALPGGLISAAQSGLGALPDARTSAQHLRPPCFGRRGARESRPAVAGAAATALQALAAARQSANPDRRAGADGLGRTLDGGAALGSREQWQP